MEEAFVFTGKHLLVVHGALVQRYESYAGRQTQAEGLWISMELILKHSVCMRVPQTDRQTDGQALHAV